MMKKTLLLLALCLAVGWISGCSDAKDVFDIELQIRGEHIFTIKGDIRDHEYRINLEENDDYWKYKDKGKVRKVEIDYLQYEIQDNRGSGGWVDLYAGDYGIAFQNTRKVATLSFGAGENRGRTSVDWVDLGYLNHILNSGRISFWAVGSGDGIDARVKVYYQIEVTVNPFE